MKKTVNSESVARKKKIYASINVSPALIVEFRNLAAMMAATKGESYASDEARLSAMCTAIRQGLSGKISLNVQAVSR